MLTLQRVGEVVGIHAREIDQGAKVWTIPAERTKNHRTHVVPLSDSALRVLGVAFDLTAKPEAKEWSGYAFPSSRYPDRPMTRHALSRAVNRLTATLKIDDAIAHDFRRTGATMVTGERIGFSRFVVSRVLNQISDTGGAAAVTGVYDRNEYLSEKRRALDAWASLLLEIAAGAVRLSSTPEATEVE
jgi:integrase